MYTIILEIILWAGLLFFFWTLRDHLGRIEERLEETRMERSRQRRPVPGEPEEAGKAATRDSRFIEPEYLFEPLGTWEGHLIHRYAMIDGQTYEFDSILPPGLRFERPVNCRILQPGLVYVRCPETAEMNRPEKS
jgi:hypothetical protein